MQRVEETFGECPFLSGELTYAWVVGAQGGVGGLNLAANTSIISEPKHYLAHSPPEGGTNTAPAHVGMREVLTNYAPQFEAGVARAGARGIMAAYSEIDGVPNCANNFTLTELLRNQWGFKGWVLGDDGAVQMMQYTHATAASPADAIVQFLTAGGNCQVCCCTTVRACVACVATNAVDVCSCVCPFACACCGAHCAL